MSNLSSTTMKTSLITIFALAIAVGPVLGEDPNDQPKQPKSSTQAAPPQYRAPQTPRVRQNANVSPRFQSRVNIPATNRVYTPAPNRRTYTPPTNRIISPNFQKRARTFTPNQDAPSIQSDGNVPNNNFRTRNPRNNPPVVDSPPPTTTVPSDTTVQSDTNVRNRDWRNRDWRNRDRNRTDNTNQDWQNRNRNRTDSTNRNRQNNRNNWQNHNTSGNYTYDQARRHHHRQRHHRSWWRSRYNRIALFAGGYYYWNNNYWYPAYGYDPYYSTYTYDEPIYGYNDLQPAQVIATVHTALQEQGYYHDEVDGLIGPRTRAALSDFQRDNGLPITAAIDGPTLKALGLY